MDLGTVQFGCRRSQVSQGCITQIDGSGDRFVQESPYSPFRCPTLTESMDIKRFGSSRLVVLSLSEGLGGCSWQMRQRRQPLLILPSPSFAPPSGWVYESSRMPFALRQAFFPPELLNYLIKVENLEVSSLGPRHGVFLPLQPAFVARLVPEDSGHFW